eukprot:SAG22_NODE_181_length_16048_cov_157.464418_17_plen_68_part_00
MSKALSSLVLPLGLCLRRCLSLPSVCPREVIFSGISIVLPLVDAELLQVLTALPSFVLPLSKCCLYL